ncbi:MAG TPA: hypothetical protein VHG52_00990, partial [Thermomicrobiales bacterium]|nr:hypothetical protein [Thermomicrobiales bacterium]
MAFALASDDTIRRSGGTFQVENNQVGRSATRILASMSRRGALRQFGVGGLAAGAAMAASQRPANAQFAITAAITEATAR